MTTTEDGIPRTDICEDCDREIVFELTELTGKHELIQQAREADGTVPPLKAGTATVVFSCACSHLEVEYGPGEAWEHNVPDGWLWEDEDDG